MRGHATSYLDVTHIAVNVPDLRAAESYYCDLFGLEAAWRDSEGAASMFATWEQLDAAGIEPGVVLVWRDAFRLALARGDGVASRGALGLNHAGLQVSVDELRAVRERVLREGHDVSGWRDGVALSFRDRYGVDWELDTRSHGDPREIIRQKEARLGNRNQREA